MHGVTLLKYVYLLLISISKNAYSHTLTRNLMMCRYLIAYLLWWCKTILGQPHNTRITHDEGTTTRNSQVHSINKIKGPTLASAHEVSTAFHSKSVSDFLFCKPTQQQFPMNQFANQEIRSFPNL